MKDVIIIGGGVVGASIARDLSKYQLDILLLEKNTEICQETTKGNSAVIHGGYDVKPGTLKAELNVRGARQFEKLSKELEFTWLNTGSLVLAFDREDMEVLKELQERGIKNGLKDLEIIGPKSIQDIEALASKKAIGALLCQSSGVIDPFNFTYALMENAMENGVGLKTETEVLDLEGKDYVRVKTNKGDFKARYVINAGGINSGRLANMAGDFDFKIIPTKGVYRVFRKDPNFKLKKVLFQIPTKESKGVLVVPTYEGSTMLGPTSENIFEEDSSNIEDSLQTIDNLGKKSAPSLDIEKSLRIFTGIRAKPDTGDFMIYPSKNTKGVVHVGGIESPGLSSAPAIADYVRDILEEIGLDLKYKKDFSPNRKKIPRPSKLGEEEKENLIKKNPEFSKRICRCENVSQGEIVEAIDRGAKTVDGVKRRTRAGMGYCQGNYCGPRVKNILAEELQIDKEDIKEELHGEELVEKYKKMED